MINYHRNHEMKDFQQMKEEMAQGMTTDIRSLEGNLRNKKEALMSVKGLFDEKREICVRKIKEKKEELIKRFDEMIVEATIGVTNAQSSIDKELLATDEYLTQLKNIRQNSPSSGYEDLRDIGESLREIERSVPETQTLEGIETLQYPVFTEIPDAIGWGGKLAPTRFEPSFLEQLSEFHKKEVTFRHTITNFSELKEADVSERFVVRALPWNVISELRTDEKTGQTYLAIFIKCKPGDQPKLWTCKASVEFKLLQVMQTRKTSSKRFRRVLTTENPGFRLLFKFNELLEEKNGYYDAKNDSITLELHVVAEKPETLEEDSDSDSDLFAPAMNRNNSCESESLL